MPTVPAGQVSAGAAVVEAGLHGNTMREPMTLKDRHTGARDTCAAGHRRRFRGVKGTIRRNRSQKIIRAACSSHKTSGLLCASRFPRAMRTQPRATAHPQCLRCLSVASKCTAVKRYSSSATIGAHGCTNFLLPTNSRSFSSAVWHALQLQWPRKTCELVRGTALAIRSPRRGRRRAPCMRRIHTLGREAPMRQTHTHRIHTAAQIRMLA
jgi:hypothetical protein